MSDSGKFVGKWLNQNIDHGFVLKTSKHSFDDAKF